MHVSPNFLGVCYHILVTIWIPVSPENLPPSESSLTSSPLRDQSKKIHVPMEDLHCSQWSVLLPSSPYQNIRNKIPCKEVFSAPYNSKVVIAR